MLSVLDDELEERYPLPDADDGQMIVEITRLELETLRRRAYRAGRLAGRTKAKRRVIEHGM